MSHPRHGTPRRSGTLRRAVAVALLTAALLGAGAAAAHAAGGGVRSAAPCVPPASARPTSAPPNGSAIDLSATVLGPAPLPTCGATGSTGAPPYGPVQYGMGGASASGSAGGDAAASVAPVVDTAALAPDEFELGGVLYVGGVNSSYSPSIDPLAGELQLWFTVRNVSKSTIDARADFWMEGPFGNRLGQADDIEIVDLKPGEKRTVSAEVPGVGQWTLVSTHATLTPPEEVDGTKLAPVTRDATVLAPPWLLGVLAVAALGYAVVRHFLRPIDLPLPEGSAA